MQRLAIDGNETLSTRSATWTGLLIGLLGPRGTSAALVAATVLGLSLIVASGVPGRIRGWVHHQPEYRWAHDRIELDPAPPPWLRLGDRSVLAAVAEPLAQFEQGSALDLDLGAVERAFKNVYWVNRVRQVRRSYPARVVVSLDYRRPVAIAKVVDPCDGAGPECGEFIVLDGNGMILDRLPLGSDQGRTFFDELVILSGLERPASFRVGQPWASASASENPGSPDPAATASAQLARFLIDRASLEGWPETRSGQILPFRKVHPYGGDPRKLYLAHELPGGQVLWVVWGPAPGDEGAIEPSAEQKWMMLRNWIASGGTDRPLEKGALGFTTRGPIWLPPV